MLAVTSKQDACGELVGWRLEFPWGLRVTWQVDLGGLKVIEHRIFR